MSPQTEKPNLLAIINQTIQKHNLLEGVYSFRDKTPMQIMIDAIMYVRDINSSARDLKSGLQRRFDLIHVENEVDNATCDFERCSDEYLEIIYRLVYHQEAFNELLCEICPIFE